MSLLCQPVLVEGKSERGLGGGKGKGRKRNQAYFDGRGTNERTRSDDEAANCTARGAQGKKAKIGVTRGAKLPACLTAYVCNFEKSFFFFSSSSL